MRTGPRPRSLTRSLVPGPGARPRHGFAAVALALTLAGVPASPAGAATGCDTWSVRTVADKLGALENALPLPDGDLLVTDNGGGRVLRVGPDGSTRVLATGLPGAGGLARRGQEVFLTTGNTFTAGLFGTTDGTITRIDPATGATSTWAKNLVMPNGLAFLRDGSAVTTRNLTGLGTPSAITRVPASGGTKRDLFWGTVPSSNGIAVDPAGRDVYVSTFLTGRAEVWRLKAAAPALRVKVADLGAGLTTGLDDLTVAADGAVYGTAFLGGAVYRLDPATGKSCILRKDVPQATAVEAVSGADGAVTRLYVTSMNGALYELTPPRG